MDKYILVRIFLISVAVVTLYLLVSRYTQRQKLTHSERFYDDINQILPLVSHSAPDSLVSHSQPNGFASQPRPNGFVSKPRPNGVVRKPQVVQPSSPLHDEDYKAVDFTENHESSNDCFPKDRLGAQDLLPKDQANSRWAQLNPAGQGDVKDQNFLQAGHLSGINTTMGSRTKNANMQLRSEPLNEQKVVSPWIQSTILPDTLRRPLEIGENR